MISIQLRKKLIQWGNKGVVLLGLLLGAYLVVMYLTPFLIAFIIAMILEPLVRFFMQRFKMGRKTASWLTMLIGLGGVGSIIVTIVIQFVAQIRQLIQNLPDIYYRVYEQILIYAEKGTIVYQELPKEVADYIKNLSVTLAKNGSQFINSFVKGVFDTAGSIPAMIFFIVITLVSLYFFIVDRQTMLVVAHNRLPKAWFEKMISLKQELFNALAGYVKAQLIMMSITFVELYIGFIIIRVEYALALAVIIAILDALPFVGTGIILIPWSVFEFITGHTRSGILLLVLYLIVILVRQMIEPKILSSQIGIHPIFTLGGMYIGLQLFGVIGFIIGPITVLILKNLFLKKVSTDSQ